MIRWTEQAEERAFGTDTHLARHAPIHNEKGGADLLVHWVFICLLSKVLKVRGQIVIEKQASL